MAAFSYQYQPFLLDSVFLPNNPLKMPCFLDEPNYNNTNCFSQFYPQEPIHHFSFDHSELSVTKKQSSDSSTLVDKADSGDGDGAAVVNQVKVVTSTYNKKRKNGRNSNSTASSTQSKAMEISGKKQKKAGEDGEQKIKNGKKEEKKVSEETATTGYIHVRARRGQATDSHSLAERVRREKISERMKTLQRLVPGCDKVTGKALMLDEIINYVQSLQNQVEFLSMKLASLNPIFFDFRMDLDGFMIQPEASLSSITPQPPSMPTQCSVIATSNIVDTTAPTTPTITATNNYPLMDHSSANLFLLQQGLNSNTYPQSQDNVKAVSSWDVEDQRRKLHISSGIGDNLCYYH